MSTYCRVLGLIFLRPHPEKHCEDWHEELMRPLPILLMRVDDSQHRIPIQRTSTTWRIGHAPSPTDTSAFVSADMLARYNSDRIQ